MRKQINSPPTASQAELLEAMRRGVVVHFLSGIHAHYFRADTMKSCTREAGGLLARGLIEEYDKDWRGSKLRPKKEAA